MLRGLKKILAVCTEPLLQHPAQIVFQLLSLSLFSHHSCTSTRELDITAFKFGLVSEIINRKSTLTHQSFITLSTTRSTRSSPGIYSIIRPQPLNSPFTNVHSVLQRNEVSMLAKINFAEWLHPILENYLYEGKLLISLPVIWGNRSQTRSTGYILEHLKMALTGSHKLQRLGILLIQIECYEYRMWPKSSLFFIYFIIIYLFLWFFLLKPIHFSLVCYMYVRTCLAVI